VVIGLCKIRSLTVERAHAIGADDKWWDNDWMMNEGGVFNGDHSSACLSQYRRGGTQNERRNEDVMRGISSQNFINPSWHWSSIGLHGDKFVSLLLQREETREKWKPIFSIDGSSPTTTETKDKKQSCVFLARQPPSDFLAFGIFPLQVTSLLCFLLLGQSKVCCVCG